MRKLLNGLIPFVILGIVGFSMFTEFSENTGPTLDREVTPNWSAIASWPQVDSGAVEATPNPNRRITAIVLDDSGSMGNDMEAAKGAVLAALDAMSPEDRVAVIALNKGILLPFMLVSDARDPLAKALRPVLSNGGTPLTGAVRAAQGLLEAEAASARSFGTYRMIVTTDGVADDPGALTDTVAAMAETTPIQLATIGIGVDGRHVLRQPQLGDFVDIDNVAALRTALQDAIAENADFEAITNFGGGG